MNKSKLEFNIILTINVLRDIIELFSGPFLTAYFIKTTAESINQISIYYIFGNLFLLIASIIVGCIIKNKFKIGSFRLGVILNFVYILTIIILKENVTNYLWLISIIFGISTSFYYMPFNLFIAKKIKNEDRTKYEVTKKFLSTITNLLVPTILGFAITVTNYISTALIILIISFIQIVLSMYLKPIEENNIKFNTKETINIIKNNIKVKLIIIIAFLSGCTISSSSLATITTILIYNAFKTDFNLGIITSISSILQVTIAFLYKKHFKEKHENKLIILSSIIPILTLIILLFYRCNITIILFNLGYNVFVNLLNMVHSIKLFNVMSEPSLKEKQVEFLVLREVSLNLGRITSFVLLLLANLSGNNFYLNLIMIILTLLIIVLGIVLKKVKIDG